MKQLKTINTCVDFFSVNSLGAKVSCQKKFPQFSLDKLEHKNGYTRVESTVDELIPGVSLSLNASKRSDKISGDLLVRYSSSRLILTGEIDIVSLSSIKASVCTGTNGITMGGDATLESGSFADFTFGAGYFTSKQAFLGIRADKKGYDISSNFLYTVNSDVTVGGNFSLSTKVLAFGGTYELNPKTALKFKLDTCGNIASSSKYSIDGRATITTAASANVSDLGKYKIGVVASLS